MKKKKKTRKIQYILNYKIYSYNTNFILHIKDQKCGSCMPGYPCCDINFKINKTTIVKSNLCLAFSYIDRWYRENSKKLKTTESYTTSSTSIANKVIGKFNSDNNTLSQL